MLTSLTIDGPVPEGRAPSVLPLVPEYCLFCNAPYLGGCQVPGQPFPKIGPRVFYRCLSSLCVRQDNGEGSVFLHAKNCSAKNPD